MNKITKLTLGFIALLLVITGCFNNKPQTNNISQSPSNNGRISMDELGLRNTKICEEDQTAGSKTEYTSATPGTSKRFKRSFQDAPPMIPHSVDGLLPIQINNNQCLSCHLPEMAKLVGSTPVPTSHFTNFRPSTSISKNGLITKSGIEIENTSSQDLANISITKKHQLVGARFNCTQCHAPQSQGKLAVKNNFEAEFTSENGKERSNWKGKNLMEGINTVNH